MLYSLRGKTKSPYSASRTLFHSAAFIWLPQQKVGLNPNVGMLEVTTNLPGSWGWGWEVLCPNTTACRSGGHSDCTRGYYARLLLWCHESRFQIYHWARHDQLTQHCFPSLQLTCYLPQIAFSTLTEGCFCCFFFSLRHQTLGFDCSLRDAYLGLQ